MNQADNKKRLTLKSVLKKPLKTGNKAVKADSPLSIRRKKKIFINNTNKKPETHQQAKKQTPSKNKHKRAFRELEKTFPAIFNLKRPKPLCIGIRNQLIAIKDKKISNNTIRLGLYFYCNSYQYLPIIVEGAPRIDAEGNESGVVTKEEEITANEKYARMIENQ